MTTTTDKKVFNNVLEAIGDTPMIRINRITKGLIKATVFAKIETVNPGNSIKDRMAVRMIEDAERAGLLKPGGTIIEGTSGNTGMGLAIAAVVKGYRCVFTTTDKQSKEKIDALRGVRRRSDRLPDQRRSRGSAVLLFGVVAAGAGDSQLLEGEPVRQSLEFCGALRGNRSGDLGADRRSRDASRRRRRYRRHDQRRRALSEGAQPADQGAGASTRMARSSRSTRRPGSSTRTRSTRMSRKASARTSCRRTSTSASSTISRR